MKPEEHGPVRRASTPVSRREFVQTSGLAVAGALGVSSVPTRRLRAEDTTPEIPKRVLGRTGEKVSILGLGTALLGHQNNNQPDVEKLVSVFSEAIDRGVSYVDTARMYGRSEMALAKVLASRRDTTFLATKVWATTYEEARDLFEESLSTLKVDHVDVLHIHNLGGKDVDRVLDDGTPGKGGSWKYLQECRKAGKTRFIGITGHQMPARYVRMLETGTVDVMMVVINFVDRSIYNFEGTVLPVARKHGTGVMAMKVFGGLQGGWGSYSARNPVPSQMRKEDHQRSVAYVKGLEGVTGMVIGVHTREQLLENIRTVTSTPALSGAELEELAAKGKSLAPQWTARFGPVS